MVVTASLEGRRIVVTRAVRQAESLCSRIESLGGEVIRLPTIQTVPPEDQTAPRRAIGRIERYDWVVFTSVNGVTAFVDLIKSIGRTMPSTVRLAAVGPITAAAVRDAGYNVDATPDQFVSGAIAGAMGEISGKRVLLARADVAGQDLNDCLVEAGAHVDDVAFYRTVATMPGADTLSLLNQPIDAVTFTSASAVRGFLKVVPHGEAVADRAAVVCIGPVTAAAARDLGIEVAVVAETFTTEGLLESMCEYFVGQDKA